MESAFRTDNEFVYGADVLRGFWRCFFHDRTYQSPLPLKAFRDTIRPVIDDVEDDRFRDAATDDLNELSSLAVKYTSSPVAERAALANELRQCIIRMRGRFERGACALGRSKAPGLAPASTPETPKDTAIRREAESDTPLDAVEQCKLTEALGCDESTLRRLKHELDIPAFRPGGGPHLLSPQHAYAIAQRYWPSVRSDCRRRTNRLLKRLGQRVLPD